MALSSELTAVFVAVIAVAMGSLIGGGTVSASADFSTAVAVLGLVVSLGKAFTCEIRALRARFGSPVLFAVLQMG